jgi:hypothetical protein
MNNRIDCEQLAARFNSSLANLNVVVVNMAKSASSNDINQVEVYNQSKILQTHHESQMIQASEAQAI